MSKKIFFSISGLLMLAVLSCCKPAPKYRFEEGMAWNTVYHITYQSPADLSDSIRKVLSEIDGSLSPFNPSSTVSKINGNLSIQTDGHFQKVFEESLRINRASQGAFDPTLAPLIRAWGFGQGHEVTADTLRIDSLLNLVGINRTRLSDTGELTKENPAIEFNFSAIAKGYGVDCVAEMLERNGVENYLVEIGGEIRAEGMNPYGSIWVVGVESPDSDVPYKEIVLNVEISGCGIATSGNYRNFQDAGSNRYGHTISPSTGRPIQSDVISATVVAPTCMEADALATCCMVVGSEKALELCSGLNVGLFIIKSDLSTQSNARFEALTRH